MTDQTPTVMIVDDDASVRKALSRLLRTVGYHVETVESAQLFLEKPRFTGPGCIVLDIRMPGLSGLELQEKLVNEGNSVPIIFITGHGDVPTGVNAMKKGAVDFLTKPFDYEDLLAAVRAGIAKDREARNKRAIQDEIKQQAATLTPREREVMALVVAGNLNKQIAGLLGISEATVKLHRGKVMRKMNVLSLAELVQKNAQALYD